MFKLLMLDLDGNVRYPKSGAKFISKPDDQAIYEPVEWLLSNPYRDCYVTGITNQGGVAAGYKSLEDAIQEQQITLRLCPLINCIYFCPDYEGEVCYKVETSQPTQIYKNECGLTLLTPSFRKPGWGMLGLAASAFELEDCLYVGDRAEDEQAAASFGCEFKTEKQWWAEALK
ncbi:MAG: polynucleotide kinase [Rivularia sp. (in: cyanobacteria)]